MSIVSNIVNKNHNKRIVNKNHNMKPNLVLFLDVLFALGLSFSFQAKRLNKKGIS